MTETFDPIKHIIVVRERETGRHVHVEWAEVLRQIEAGPSVDLAPLLSRLQALERRESPPIEARTQAVPQEIADALADASAAIARLNQRMVAMELAHAQHEHAYRLSPEDITAIAGHVYDHVRKVA